MKLHLAIVLLFVGCAVAQEWIQLASLFGEAKPFRQGHSAAITLFGRMVSFSGLDNTLTGSLQITRFNYLSNSQIQILPNVPSNNRPSRQLSAYGTFANNVLVQYGGLVGGENSNELLMFDITLGTWDITNDTFLTDSVHNIENHFAFSANSVAGAVDQTGNGGNGFFYLFGGSSTALLLQFITKVKLDTHEFIQVNTSTSTMPDRRFGSAMAVHASATLWLFGGMSSLGTGTNLQDVQIFGDTWAFDISSSTWSQPTLTGTAPSARAYAANVIRADGVTWVIFGGENDQTQTWFNDVFSFDLSGTTWTPVTVSGTPPSRRSKMTGVLLAWSGEDSLLFHGGTDNTGGSLNEFWKLQIISNGTSPLPAPTSLDVGADVTDASVGTTAPPPVSTHQSSSHAVTGLEPASGVSSLSSWLQWN